MSVAPLGLLIAVCSSLAWAGFDALRKVLVQGSDSRALVVVLSAAQVPLFGAWTLLEGARIEPADYALPAAASVGLNVLANYLFLEAVRHSPLSLTIPLLSFSPAFAALVAVPLLGEWPTLRQVFGIALVVVGAVSLHAPQLGARERLSRILGRIARERGSVYMVIVALLWSLTASMDKLALRHCSVGLHGLVLALGVAFGMVAVLIVQGEAAVLSNTTRRLGGVAAAAVAVTVALGLQLWAVQLMLVSFVEAMKRAVGMTASLVLGRLVFGERIGRAQVLAISVMAAGVAFIVGIG
ncbi:MAG TPA: DMT family transporter [Polyangiaceae bacterium]|nr:DMT family transporter [Polyangiaceae bacterium]